MNSCTSTPPVLIWEKGFGFWSQDSVRACPSGSSASEYISETFSEYIYIFWIHVYIKYILYIFLNIYIGFSDIFQKFIFILSMRHVTHQQSEHLKLTDSAWAWNWCLFLLCHSPIYCDYPGSFGCDHWFLPIIGGKNCPIYTLKVLRTDSDDVAICHRAWVIKTQN